MRLEGKRIKKVRWVHANPCVVRVEVEAVVPIGDPSEPCYEPETVYWLRTVRERADAGDIAWLKNNGKVYVRQVA